MITRQTIKDILEDYLMGAFSEEQVSDWAYEMIVESVETSDELVKEILYNLVSFNDSGFVFRQYTPNREKLEYFMHWLDGDRECNWDQYTAIFDPAKLC